MITLYIEQRPPMITPDIETVDMAPGFRVVKYNGMYVCLQGNQTSKNEYQSTSLINNY